MISPSNIGTQVGDLGKRDLADYGVARFQDQVFDAVLTLWRRRQSEGWLQKDVADAIDRDPSWVSKNLRAPGNWTLRTAGEFVQGLRGEANISVTAAEDPPEVPGNFDAYEGYLIRDVNTDLNVSTSIDVISFQRTNIDTIQKPVQLTMEYGR
jgi:hypothetical protein